MSDLDKFLKERSRIPIPNGDVARVKLLAKELALGAHKNLWDTTMIAISDYGRWKPCFSNLETVFEKRWTDHDFGRLADLLIAHRYAESLENALSISSRAFDLLDETAPYDVFISYKRSESSAFALLVLARLNEHGLVPFVDMALEAGGKWHADLEERIRGCDYFIILLGKDTLSSPMTVKEIQWALQYERTIIPAWHSGFDLKDEKRSEIDETVKDAIQQTNAIRVHDESASGYNSAIVELLNRFGVTP